MDSKKVLFLTLQPRLLGGTRQEKEASVSLRVGAMVESCSPQPEHHKAPKHANVLPSPREPIASEEQIGKTPARVWETRKQTSRPPTYKTLDFSSLRSTHTHELTALACPAPVKQHTRASRFDRRHSSSRPQIHPSLPQREHSLFPCVSACLVSLPLALLSRLFLSKRQKKKVQVSEDGGSQIGMRRNTRNETAALYEGPRMSLFTKLLL